MDQNQVVTAFQPVDTPFLDAGRHLLSKLVERGIPVNAAGWLQTDYDGKPYLYIVTSESTDGLGNTLTSVIAVYAELNPTPVDLLDLRLITDRDPVGRALLSYTDRYRRDPMDSTYYPDKRIREEKFIGVGVQGPVFVYAPVVSPAATGN